MYSVHGVRGVQNCLMSSLFIQYIRYEMPRKFGLGTGAKEKFEALEGDLDNLTRTLWRSDECRFRHDRIRLQLTFYVLVHAYSLRCPAWHFPRGQIPQGLWQVLEICCFGKVFR